MKEISENIFYLNNKIYSNNNNNLLEGIKNELEQINNYCKDSKIIEKLNDVQIKIKYIISENIKNTELIKQDIYQLIKKINDYSDEIKINIKNNKEINYINKQRNM